MNLTYLYNDGEFWHFMNNETFEQLSADAKAIGDNAKWLLDQAECIVTLWNGQPISVTPPNFVELKLLIPTQSEGRYRRYWRQTSHAVYWRSG